MSSKPKRSNPNFKVFVGKVPLTEKVMPEHIDALLPQLARLMTFHYVKTGEVRYPTIDLMNDLITSHLFKKEYKSGADTKGLDLPASTTILVVVNVNIEREEEGSTYKAPKNKSKLVMQIVDVERQ